MRRPRLLPALLRSAAFWTGVIALATLTPVNGPTLRFAPCLICGDRGTADALSNVLLFLPLGLALAQRSPKRAPYWIPISLSLVVEMAQYFLPGRNPAYGDLLFNSIGGCLGIWLGIRSHRWWNRSERVARHWLTLVIAAPGLFLVLTAMLVAPDPTDGVYFGQWTPEFRRLEKYDGRLTTAKIGTESLRDGRLVNSAEVRAMIEQDAALRVVGVAGHPPRSLAPVLALVDDGSRQMFLVGIDRVDVVYHYRSRAVAWRLDHVELRAPGLATGLNAGGPLQLDVRPQADGVQFEVNGQKQMVAAPSLGMGWRLLFGSERFPRWLGRLLDYAWLIVLIAPAGYWSRTVWSSAGSGALFLLLLASLPSFSWLAPTPLPQYVAALFAMAIGVVAARLLPPSARNDSYPSS